METFRKVKMLIFHYTLSKKEQSETQISILSPQSWSHGATPSVRPAATLRRKITKKVTTWMIVIIFLGGGYSAYESMGKLEDPAFTIKQAKIP